MTHKEQNKILDDKIESNVNQYKVDRLNAEISAFSRGDLNKYEFLTTKDLKYKPNALDKARFEFSPLGKTFSTGLDKTIPNYQVEGVIKLLKDIRDGLAGGIGPTGPPGPGGLDRPDNDNNDDMSDLETEEEAAKRIAKTTDNDKIFDILNKFKNNMEVKTSNLDETFTDKENELIAKLNKWSSKLNKLNNDVKKLDNYIKENNDKRINTEKKLDIINNKRDNLLLKYNQLNQGSNTTNYMKKKLYKLKKN